MSKKNKNSLFMTSHKNILHPYLLSDSSTFYLIAPKSVYSLTDLEKLRAFYTEIILVDHYSNSGEVEVKIRELHERQPLDKILILAEGDVLRAARLRDWLQMSGQSYKSALAFRDKIIMKEYLKQADIKLPEFFQAMSATDVQVFYERKGLPLIVKPLRGNHVQKTYLIQNKGELNAFLKKPGIFDEFHSASFEVEEYIEGTMYQIDGVIRGGDLLAIWPSRYINTSLSLLNGKVFGSHLLSDENPLTARLNEYARKVLQALPAPLDSVFHLEVFYTPQDEIVFCEIASRVGGGPTRDFWLQAFGVDLTKEFFKAQLEEPPSEELINFSKKPKKIPGIIMYPPAEGKILKSIEKKCGFPWVEKYELNCREGKKMTKPKKLEDFRALISINAPNDAILMERFNEFDRWFGDTNIFYN